MATTLLPSQTSTCSDGRRISPSRRRSTPSTSATTCDLWQTPASAPDGRPIWLAAATHDVGIDVHPGVISHATDSNLDDERAQVGSDLYLGGAVQAAELIAPPNPLSSGMTATGGAWHTDGRLFVIDLKGGAASGM